MDQLGRTNVTTRGKLGIEYAEPQKEQVRPRNAVEPFAKMIMKMNQGIIAATAGSRPLNAVSRSEVKECRSNQGVESTRNRRKFQRKQEDS